MNINLSENTQKILKAVRKKINCNDVSNESIIFVALWNQLTILSGKNYQNIDFNEINEVLNGKNKI